MRWWWCPLSTRSTSLVWIFIQLTHWSNSLHVDISHYSDTLFWFWAKHVDISHYSHIILILSQACRHITLLRHIILILSQACRHITLLRHIILILSQACRSITILWHIILILSQACRYTTLFRHIIMILSQPVFALFPQHCMLSREAANTNLIVFGLTRPGLEPTIYRTRGKHVNHYTTDAVNLACCL